MAKPIIGITSFLERSKRPMPYIALKESYVRAIEAAGGIAMVLPVIEGRYATDVIAVLDGIVFSGGGDVAPWFFGQEPVPGLGSYDSAYDSWEIELCNAAWDAGLPFAWHLPRLPTYEHRAWGYSAAGY